MSKWLTLVLLVIGAALALTGCIADSEGVRVGDPVRFAESTHVAKMSEAAAAATRQAVEIEATRQTADIQARATAAAIAHAQAQAQADKIKAQAQAEQNALPAASMGRALGYVGLGVGVLVLAVGLAFGVVAWVGKRASTVYPDGRGQFPVIVRKGAGFISYHDPNRGLGPGTVLHTPGLIERAGYALALARGKVEPLQPGAEYPQPGTEATMLQIATQEQAAQVRIAEQSGRPKIMLVTGAPEPARPSAARGRMPSVTVVNDPAQIESFERKLLPDGD